MTSTELFDRFLLLYDINGNAAVGFEDYEIYDLLSAAQLNLAKDLFSRFGPTAVSTIISYDTVGISKIANCEYSVNDSQSALYYNTLFLIDASINVTRTFAPEISIPEPVHVEILSPALIDKFRCTSYNKTVFLQPKLFIGTNLAMDNLAKTKLITDPYTIIDTNTAVLNVTRVIIPENINENTSAILDEKWHDTIVEEAVKLAILTTSDQRTNVELQLPKN